MTEIDTDAERAKSDEWLTRRDHYLLWRAAAEYLDTIDRLRAEVARLNTANGHLQQELAMRPER